jgi:hypothetical protein
MSEYKETTGWRHLALKMETAVSPKRRQNSLLENNDVSPYKTLLWGMVRGCFENFSASTIDGNTIGKIFLPKLVHLS